MAKTVHRILLGATLALQCAAAPAAEWAVSPVLGWDADTHSNRTLRAGAPASEAIGASVDVLVSRRSETSEFTFAPHYALRRFSNDVVPDVDDARLLAAMNFGFERATLSFGGEYSSESTLTTELAETGVVLADAARRTQAVNAAWAFEHADARRLSVTANYQDVDYTGAYTGQLFGYGYGAYSVGESFTLSPRTSWSVTGFASRLNSPERGSESRERGVSLGFDFAWNERTRVAVTAGASRRDIDGAEDTGATGTLALSHQAETRQYSFDYSHSLVPFGTGVLTERDTAELSCVQALSARLRGTVRLGYTRNEDAGFGLDLDRRAYRFADTEVLWQLTETWYAALAAGYAEVSDLHAPDVVGGWSLSVRTRWAPARRVFGH